MVIKPFKNVVWSGFLSSRESAAGFAKSMNADIAHMHKVDEQEYLFVFTKKKRRG